MCCNPILGMLRANKLCYQSGPVTRSSQIESMSDRIYVAVVRQAGMIRAGRWRGAPPRRHTLGWVRRCDRDGPRQIRAPRVQVHHDDLHAGASHCELGPAHERSGCDEGSAPRRAADAPRCNCSQSLCAVSSRTISLPFHAEWRRGRGDILCSGGGALGGVEDRLAACRRLAGA